MSESRFICWCKPDGLDGILKESTSKEETAEGNQLAHIWIGIILRRFQMPLRESSLAYNL